MPQSSATLHLPDGRVLSLRHVLFFHRHGDRSPVFTDMGEKWRITDEGRGFWASRLASREQLASLDRIARVVGDDPTMPRHGAPVGHKLWPLGQLSAQGVEHMVAKGEELRKRYEAFIAASPGLQDAPQDHVHVLSSNMDRTIQSVQCLLYGMFIAPTITTVPPTTSPSKQFSICTQAKNALAPAHSDAVFEEIESIVTDSTVLTTPCTR
ncbi:hypothetical protein P43SY_002013 [Pythium insidiosum]|uniref:Histidine acid phosphatase n=1 Tax=Pythium insidiosum TaxID=114742 RepID=A0AAD5M3W4_PYTIN|nr:hypothetical protein P43SY_002013 [Pythium insidiosum]